METILLIGEDLPLLASRSAVLSRLGVTVFCYTSADLEAHPPSQDVDLALLCHTLPPDRRQTTIQIIHERWKPRAKILQLESPLDDHEPSGADFVVDSWPEKLIERMKEILARTPDRLS